MVSEMIYYIVSAIIIFCIWQVYAGQNKTNWDEEDKYENHVGPFV